MSLVLSHREHMYPIRHVCFVVKKSNINQIINWTLAFIKVLFMRFGVKKSGLMQIDT